MNGRYDSPVKLALVALAALLLVQSPSQAQSFLASRGLGLPAQPFDARAAGLGGVHAGLPGVDLSVHNPAGAVTVPAPTFRAVLRPESRSSEFGGQSESGSSVRFPLFQAAFRFGERWAASAAYAGYLDQNWAVEVSDSVPIGGTPIEVTDLFSSRGGVSRFQLGLAYQLRERLSLGADLHLYTGGVRRQLSRLVGEAGQPSRFAAEGSYQGVGFAAGLRWLPAEAVTVAAAVSAGGRLEAELEEGDGTLVDAAGYDLPVSLTVGGSARLTAATTAVLSLDWTGWSSADDQLRSSGGARNGWSVAGGVEWDSGSEDDRSFPLRLGGRYEALPFRMGEDQDGWPNEFAASAGVGARLAQGAARIDLALERGKRSGPGISDDFWGLTGSLTVFGR